MADSAMNDGTDYAGLARRVLPVAGVSLVGLVVMMLLTTAVLPSGGRAPNLTVGLLLSLPLLVVLPWVVRGVVAAHIWASFVSLLYFGIAVTSLFLPRGGIADWIELLLSIVLFSSTLLFARWRSRALRGAGTSQEV